ncbi:hypothetical protein AX17_007423 [Amanita inopinata Kibby_2008]|nr:hypothetical protein AX17_007423 [Amanita inopinata Kibby_2008]
MLSSITSSDPPFPPSLQFESTGTEQTMGLGNLPYDLLLNIATYLDLHDIHALHLTCKSLHDFASTRPVYRKLAHDLLWRCRALPLKGFQRLSDLPTDQLIRAVNKASRLEIAWRRRAPRPIQARDACSDIFDDEDGPESTVSRPRGKTGYKWYKVVSAPPNEEVDWLSPITSKYTLCATKSGKVVCWDVKTNTCLAEWSPVGRWELWKCRVEFDKRAVFFTMAKVIAGSYDDDRIMEFVLMRLDFSDSPSGGRMSRPPVFSRITSFKSAGVVMNVFLLDPSNRLLSAFVWVSSSNAIGLYVLLDWAKSEYVFIDTGIEGVMSSNWSCILFEGNIVIHCEESDEAYQHFYPIPLLRRYNRKMTSKMAAPTLAGRVSPARTLSKNFTFPRLRSRPLNFNPFDMALDNGNAIGVGTGGFANAILTPGGMLLPLPPDIAANLNAGLADGGAVNLAQILTPEQLEQIFAQAPLFAFAPGQNAAAQQQQPAQAEQGQLPLTQAAEAAATDVPGNQGVANGLVNLQPTEDAEEDEDDEGGANEIASDDENPVPNPFPFPPWYPESAHFVRQWWPTLPGVPRISCTVVLLAIHDQQTHRTRFVLAQHYFRVPLDWKSWRESGQAIVCSGRHKGKGKAREKRRRSHACGNKWINGTAREGAANGTENESARLWGGDVTNSELGEGTSSSPHRTPQCDADQESTPVCPTYDHDDGSESDYEDECQCGWAGEQYENMGEEEDRDNSMRIWYVATPFEVVCVLDGDEDEDGQPVDRPRPLVAVDFGHAVWIEYVDVSDDGRPRHDDDDSEVSLSEDDDADQTNQGDQESTRQNQNSNHEIKRLRFVTFPAYSNASPEGTAKMEGVVRTLKIPDELDLDTVETINIDQSQGAVILSVREGKIFILCYE